MDVLVCLVHVTSTGWGQWREGGGGRRAVHGRRGRRTFTMGDPRGGGQISGLSEAAVVIIDVLGVEQWL